MSKERKKIIFVCVGNSCRSQMAEGFARHYAKQMGLDVEIHSAGTQPAGYVHADAIDVMREKGIDISQQSSKSVASFDLREFDYVISMGCLESNICPANFHGVSEDWGIPDPIGRGLEFYRQVRDMIEERVRKLLETVSRRA
ncbi:MAG: arsenate reductase ArsC [Candidatus Bipolaricaulota bacterium]|nr:arsenate reductase ArsC [Candidatus Bipolaricaulota bacterium]MCS7275336.1 arsenate reductase ArsC [Candidatus Bipolaricaulota bacterium]MDW8110165.1 arsenate reductase ArsC [Candidatus Bipolaricaulota bacterium]MDW8329197.1 arsenate reductase ArsC [Candidatus Bipolaricaulota bacterium]